MLLETSRRYNPGSESITFLKDFSYNREDFAKAGENRDQERIGLDGQMLFVMGPIVTREPRVQGLSGCEGKAPLVFPRQKVGMLIGLSQLLQIDTCSLVH